MIIPSNVSTAPEAPKGSFYFGGTYASIAGSSNYDLTGDFTVEAFVRAGADGSVVSTYGGWWLQRRSDYGGFCFGIGDTFSLVRPYSTTNTWVHVAVSRNSFNMKMFFDGVQQGSALYDTYNWPSYSNNLFIGRLLSSGFNQITGYISNLRIVVGTAVYTNDFTKPSVPLTNVEGTRLLTCQNPTTIVDNSPYQAAITSTASPSAINPFS